MVKTKGYAAFTSHGKLEPFNFERRELRENDILIEIMYCGICHSDIHQVRSEWSESSYPIVPGHEIVGRVSAVGDSVRKFKVNDLAGVGCMVDSCKACDACKDNAEYDCAAGGPVWTYNSKDRQDGKPTYGGYSNNIVVGESFALKISKDADPAATAPLLCAGTTTYTPLKFWNVGPGQRVAVFGLGGLGHIAVKLARSMGAEVTVLTRSKVKADDAIRLGASEAVVLDNDAYKKQSGRFDLILDTLSSNHDPNPILGMLKSNGKLVLVGLPVGTIDVMPFSIVSGHKILTGSGIGGIKGTQEMLDYCADNKIACDIEIIPIQKVNEAYERLLKSDVKYRFVIDMSSLKPNPQ